MRDDTTLGGPPDIPGFVHASMLGRGGFAEVHRYEQVSLGRDVAVKVLHGLDEEARRHFRAEAHVMARLSGHPSIVPIYQVGESDDGRPYLVMQLCPPPHLADRIRAGGLPVTAVLEAGVQLAGAVESAHRLGVLHRDIKPANILFSEYGRPMLADFGIASSAAVETPLHAFSPRWAPPEQVDAGAATPQVDVYSLAATLWAMLSGDAPGPRDADAPARPGLGRDDVPDLLEDALLTGLARDPRDRYETALGLARNLQQVQHHLGLPVTAVELWDGRGRRDGADTLTQPPPDPDPATAGPTELVPLPDPASGQAPRGASRPVDRDGASPGEGHEGHEGRGLTIAWAVFAAALLVVALGGLGAWSWFARGQEEPAPGAGTSETATTPAEPSPTPTAPAQPTEETTPPATTPTPETPAPETSRLGSAPETPPSAPGTEAPTTDAPGELGGGGWGT